MIIDLYKLKLVHMVTTAEVVEEKKSWRSYQGICYQLLY